MKVLFAQLCKLYTFFLVAIATVALGAPLENVPMLKRDTNPGCPPNAPVYFSSHCETAFMISATCKTNGNPPVYTPSRTPCKPGEYCIEHYSAIGFDPKNPKNPHATCVTSQNCRIWDNFSGDPNANACSAPITYNNKGRPGMMVAMTIYAHDWKPIQVNWLDAYDNNNSLPEDVDKHNYTAFISNYQGDTLKYCFKTGTNNRVIGYAAAWAVYPNSDALPSDDSSNTPV